METNKITSFRLSRINKWVQVTYGGTKMYPFERLWIFNNNNEAVAILDRDCIYDKHGYVTSWIEEDRIYTMIGYNMGFIEPDGTVVTEDNKMLGYIQGSINFDLFRYKIKTAREPIFAPRPEKPEFIPGFEKPPFGGRSHIPLELYLYG